MKFIKNNITAVDGFTALGKCIGIKKGKKDFAVIYSDKICSAAAVYTKNKVKGAPLYVDMEHLKNGKAQAIVINSGIANVATGQKGINDAVLTCKLAAKELKINPYDVLVASTGIIGKNLPMDVMKKGIKGSLKQLKKVNQAAQAILTTDTMKKEIAVKVDNFVIGAIAKGSGMIHPNMATMLCFITTDADLSSSELKKCLVNAVNGSFNMVSVDMDTSTSDMVTLMSNNTKKVDKNKFQKALNFVCKEMAKKIAYDGEGATKLIEVTVLNAKTKKDAVKISKGIITSNLFKCAMFGNDPNWGRIMCAIGNSDAYFNQDKVDIVIQNKLIVHNGVEVSDFNKKKISKLLKKDKVKVIVDLNLGKEETTAYGCDMSYGYVEINAEYHT
ncbi:MAG: bifunctional glutamate N-acetyltransferase/amino-acid acetyltransferase ArgJ [Nanoarchaeota archaeon]|nr:bifunctional glutamate N-acetyltransferase/amino-acid acetyltransferase ArgJ [Nanoarchaeota archaeon]MBU1005910.1 bifunctional glutamate N-acetyltransferase/amino-acid acetyltransferase ArgJ [Nanoarchaeota archaeon]MBU1945385.1 bifunctional glutamate N-acetyltransferase/amino-acid acetyltransferase ArgJ [Nanoarchaeota archaeon]